MSDILQWAGLAVTLLLGVWGIVRQSRSSDRATDVSEFDSLRDELRKQKEDVEERLASAERNVTDLLGQNAILRAEVQRQQQESAATIAELRRERDQLRERVERLEAEQADTAAALLSAKKELELSLDREAALLDRVASLEAHERPEAAT